MMPFTWLAGQTSSYKATVQRTVQFSMQQTQLQIHLHHDIFEVNTCALSWFGHGADC